MTMGKTIHAMRCVHAVLFYLYTKVIALWRQMIGNKKDQVKYR